MNPEEANQTNQPEVVTPSSENQSVGPVQQPTVITPTEPTVVVPSELASQTNPATPVTPPNPVMGQAPQVPPSATVPPTNEAIASAAPMPAQPMSSADIAKQNKKSGILKFGIIPLIIIAVILLGSAGAGAYFGIIVPNNPSNLWKTSLNRTGKGLDKYLEYVKTTEQDKGSKIKGNFSVDASGTVFDGNFEGSTYDKDANIKADIGAAGSRVNVELLMNTPASAKNPDIYMRVKGLDGLSSVLGVADPSTSKLLKQVNNQWYVVDHTLLDQLASETGSSAAGVSSLSAQDITEIETAVVNTTQKYVLSSAPETAVLTVRQNVGKEVIDGRKVYHYKVGINKNNTKQYLTALKDELKKTQLGKTYKDQEFEKSIGFDDMLKEVDKMHDDGVADVWVDTSTKLLRSVKFTNRDHNTNYLQISLNYNGGKVFPLEVKLHSDTDGTTDATLKVEQDLGKKTATLELSLEGSDTTSKVKASGKVVAEANNDKVEFTKPADAKSVYELLGGLMGGYSTLGDSTDIPSVLGNFDL